MSNHAGLRLRITLVAVVAVGIALSVGAFVVVALLRSRLDTAATTAAELRARDVAALVRADALPRSLALPGEESAFVQVVSSSSVVLASTNNIEGEAAVSTLRPDNDEEVVTTMIVRPLEDLSTMRVAILRVQSPNGYVTVFAGESLSSARSTTLAVMVLLIIGVPLLTAMVGLLTWWAVGRTLKPVRFITATLADITARDLHRRVPVTSTDEIGELALTVNNTLARLDTAVQTQRQFVADASHELRSPLAALRADLEVSTLHPTVTSWNDTALDMLGDIERLQYLTNDLLLLARLDGQDPSPRARLDVSLIVAEAITDVHRPGVAVTRAGVVDACHVDGDAAQLQRMVRNLLHNAETHAKNQISVELARTSTTVTLAVSDDGPGIAAEDHDVIFERFVRLDEARSRDAGGSGLGLAIVNEVVRSHGGSIRVQNGDLGGACFSVELPAHHRG